MKFFYERKKKKDHGIWPHIPRQIEGEKMVVVTDFFLGSKIIVDGDYNHEIRRQLLLGRKAMTNLYLMLKSRDITLPTKVHKVEAICRGPAPVDPGNSKWGRRQRGSGNNCLIKH